MKRLLILSVAGLLCLPFALGCERKAETQKSTTVTTPEGETTKTDTTTVESSGENPPAAEGQKVPPQ
jgi:hypothetical protein